MVTDAAASANAGTIAIRNVSKVFTTQDGRTVRALSPTSLTIQAGELVSLVGPSGCGKSTLLRLIAGLDRPTGGDLYLDDSRITGPHAERGLVFQDPTLFPWLNVQRNVRAGLVARRIKDHRNADVAELIKLIGLTGFEKSYPHQLSGGMAQRVALARAIVNRPKVLLLDEPLGALDAFTRMRMQDEVLRIWQDRNTTMVLVTHDIDEAIYMSDRIVIMSPRPGKVETVLDVPLMRPRQRNDSAFLELRTHILEMLHFAHRNNIEYYL